MAGNEAQEERRADTVAIPRSTVKSVTWVASVSFLAIAGFIWDIGNQVDDVGSMNNVMQLRIKYLEDFGPHRGDRFTKGDGIELKDEIEAIRQWMLEIQKSMNEHHAKGEHSFAGRRLDRIEQWMNEHEKRLKVQGKIRSDN